MMSEGLGIQQEGRLVSCSKSTTGFDRCCVFVVSCYLMWPVDASSKPAEGWNCTLCVCDRHTTTAFSQAVGSVGTPTQSLDSTHQLLLVRVLLHCNLRRTTAHTDCNPRATRNTRKRNRSALWHAPPQHDHSTRPQHNNTPLPIKLQQLSKHMFVSLHVLQQALNSCADIAACGLQGADVALLVKESHVLQHDTQQQQWGQLQQAGSAYTHIRHTIKP